MSQAAEHKAREAKVAPDTMVRDLQLQFDEIRAAQCVLDEMVSAHSAGVKRRLNDVGALLRTAAMPPEAKHDVEAANMRPERKARVEPPAERGMSLIIRKNDRQRYKARRCITPNVAWHQHDLTNRGFPHHVKVISGVRQPRVRDLWAEVSELYPAIGYRNTECWFHSEGNEVALIRAVEIVEGCGYDDADDLEIEVIEVIDDDAPLGI